MQQSQSPRATTKIVLLILITTALRLAFAADATGLGVDRGLHGRRRPLARALATWTIPRFLVARSWAVAHLLGSEAPIVVRLPFILLFALTTLADGASGTGGGTVPAPASGLP